MIAKHIQGNNALQKEKFAGHCFRYSKVLVGPLNLFSLILSFYEDVEIVLFFVHRF